MRKKISLMGNEIYQRTAHALFRLKSRKKKFIDIYRKNGFGGRESISGPGSSFEQTMAVRRELPLLLKDLDIRSLLDAPCGDFHWMQQLIAEIENYIGLDIVPHIVTLNQTHHGNYRRKFMVADITKDPLPAVDLILCRDCLIHLSFKDIQRVLNNFCRSRSRYLLTTTFVRMMHNRDIVTGRVRYINLQKEPFNFPEPLRIINEECTEQNGECSDKSLGLWKIDESLLRFERNEISDR
jgi:SAM-dependent methyltransferase